jgi:UDP-sugar transporter A1/2/3
MKILTTAAFSVALLRRKLTTTKWLSLFFLAIGVGIVQIQSSSGSRGGSSVSSAVKDLPVGSAHDFSAHVMNPLKGFGAVTAACFTSGLAGVYFEMVLKNSKADLWVRNVQLSLFSLIPALLPILYAPPIPHSQGLISDLLRNFGFWAWATVSVQVFGGLVTALVIKYSDNILKGFATSLSIVLSFLASVALFDFHITWSFMIGATTVLTATWMYNQPPGKEPIAIVLTGAAVDEKDISAFANGSPISEKSFSDSPIFGDTNPIKRKQAKASPFSSPRIIASALGMATTASTNLHPSILEDKEQVGGYFGEILDTARYNSAPYGSPWNSRAPSRVPSRPATPSPTTSPALSPTAVSYLNSNLKETEGR